jgi:hypothetical protein
MKVLLTWQRTDGRIFTEECELVQEGDELWTVDGEILDAEYAEDLMRHGFVLFKDDEGVFTIGAQQVIRIDKQEE